MIISSPKDCDIVELKALWKEAFGDTDEFINSFFDAAFQEKRCRCAKTGDKVIAALYWFDCEYQGQKAAYLYAIATAKSERGKGVCRELMQIVQSELEQMGYVGSMLVPCKQDLFAFYNKLGYNDVCYINEFEVLPSNKVEFRKISKEEYGILRKSFLPKSAVLQEGENLDFLALSCEFYLGDGFIFIAYKEDTILYVTELLGNIDIASGIVAAFDCNKGIFRTVGNKKPFALWMPIGTKKLPCPDYFGFAFD